MIHPFIYNQNCKLKPYQLVTGTTIYKKLIFLQKKKIFQQKKKKTQENKKNLPRKKDKTF